MKLTFLGTRGAEKRNPRHPGDQREVVQKGEPGIGLSPEPHAQETQRRRETQTGETQSGARASPPGAGFASAAPAGVAVCSHLGGPPAKTAHANDK